MGQNSLVVSVSIWLHLYCFPYELVHAPGHSGEDAGIVEQYMMAGAYVVFHHYQFLGRHCWVWWWYLITLVLMK